MFPYKCQLIFWQRQSPHNVFNEIVRRYCCQVPLQLPQHHQFPFLERERVSKERAKKITEHTVLQNWSRLVEVQHVNVTICEAMVLYSNKHVAVKHYCYYVRSAWLSLEQRNTSSVTNPGDLTTLSPSRLCVCLASGDFPKEAHQRFGCMSAV